MISRGTLCIKMCAVPYKSQFTVAVRTTIIESSSKVINAGRLFENKGFFEVVKSRQDI